MGIFSRKEKVWYDRLNSRFTEVPDEVIQSVISDSSDYQSAFNKIESLEQRTLELKSQYDSSFEFDSREFESGHAFRFRDSISEGSIFTIGERFEYEISDLKKGFDYIADTALNGLRGFSYDDPDYLEYVERKEAFERRFGIDYMSFDGFKNLKPDLSDDGLFEHDIGGQGYATFDLDSENNLESENMDFEEVRQAQEYAHGEPKSFGNFQSYAEHLATERGVCVLISNIDHESGAIQYSDGSESVHDSNDWGSFTLFPPDPDSYAEIEFEEN